MTRPLLSTFIAAIFAVMSIAMTPAANAAPLVTPKPQTSNADVQNVQWRRGGPGFYRGHRGYRTRCPGCRYHNGFWFPAAAFLGAAIIGGAIAAQSNVGSRHVSWCYSRYRSYREWDNTYQPYQGPRRQCHSPYN